MAFGIGKAFKKAWKKTLGWTDDSWMTDVVIPVAATIVGGVYGGPVGAMAAASVTTGARSMHLQQKQQKQELAMQRDIANQQAMAAAVPIATSAAQQEMVNAETADTNYATDRRRALSMSDTRTSSRLQRWAKNGKRRTL